MSPTDSDKKYKLTVFLIKDGYEAIEDFLSFSGFNIIDVENDGEQIGQLIYKGGFESTPAWVSLFEDVPGFNKAAIKNKSSKAVFVLQHEGRWFCFTFGYARHLLDDHAYERNFGLIVTLNSSDPLAIKSIDKTNISHISLHSKEQATKAIELANFEFDNEIDLLKSVTAKTSELPGVEKETISGRDSVTIHTRAIVDDFPDIAKDLHEAFTDTKYKEIYPWLDKIREERDKAVIERLDCELTSRIAHNDFHKIWLAIPEIIPWEEIDGFAYKYKAVKPYKSGPVTYQDLDIHQWTTQTKISDGLSAKQLKNKRIHVCWQDGRHTQWSAYRCLNAEIDLDSSKYILNDGDWYNINPDFVDEVSNFFQSVPDSDLQLPAYDSRKEPEYLKYVADNSPDFSLMDSKNIMIGGSGSRVEFCDLFSKDNDIIHVKRYGGSSLLSHLFSQAFVSGRCFLHEEDFRIKLNEELPDGYKLLDPTKKPVAADYNVCIAVMSQVPGPLELPFFSKVSFKHAVKALQDFGYNVYKLKIER